jgi:hypothetical protein
MSRRIGIFFMFAILSSLVIFPVAAHEGRAVGEYNISIGWRVEPAYVGVFNGPEVHITSPEAEEHEEAAGEHAESEEHGEDTHSSIAAELQIEVSFGDQSVILPLRSGETTGHFIGDLIPTLPGDYTFHLTGTIGETVVDETFTSANGEFSTIEPASDIMFPVLDDQE